MQWLMLQQPHPEDYVIATGVQHSVRDFVDQAARCLGITLAWEGNGVQEKGVVEQVTDIQVRTRENGAARPVPPRVKPGDVIVAVDPMYFRPSEVETLLGDASKAREKLGWEPEIRFQDMVTEMVCHDLEEARRDAFCRKQGFTTCDFNE